MKYASSLLNVSTKCLAVSYLSLSCLLLSSCSSINSPEEIQRLAFRPSLDTIVTLAGPAVITLAGPATLSTNDQNLSPSPLLGLTGGSFGKELQISLDKKQVVLLENGSPVMETELSDLSDLQTGTFVVTLKKRDPLWYAPDSYYIDRHLSIPDTGDKDRYLRGAFGSFALFIGANAEDSKVLHAGNYNLSEVPGARLNEESLAKVFYTLEAGDKVVIK